MTDLLIESTVLEDRLRAALPTDVDYASARLVDERTEHLSVRRNELEPVFNEFDTGVMISIWNGGGLGYAATTDLSEAGLAAAVDRARYWAGVTAGAMVTTAAPTSHAIGHLRVAGRGHLGHTAPERPARTPAPAIAVARHRRPHRQLGLVVGAPRRRPTPHHHLQQRRRRPHRAALPVRLPEPARHGERGHQHPDPHVRRPRVLRPGRRRSARPVRVRRRRVERSPNRRSSS